MHIPVLKKALKIKSFAINDYSQRKPKRFYSRKLSILKLVVFFVYTDNKVYS